MHLGTTPAPSIPDGTRLAMLRNCVMLDILHNYQHIQQMHRNDMENPGLNKITDRAAQRVTFWGWSVGPGHDVLCATGRSQPQAPCFLRVVGRSRGLPDAPQTILDGFGKQTTQIGKQGKPHQQVWTCLELVHESWKYND